MANTRSIPTQLVERDEVFRFLAVCEAVRLPGLLEGPPGVGKTRALLDYGKGLYGGNTQEMMAKTFILETDEGTRSADVKGRIDMKKLLQQNEYHMISPIVSAKFILINEIDKANPGLRNSLLGIMNEGYLFNGQDKVPCAWDVMVAACNKIPTEEKNNPFWDRFVLKMEVKRISKSQMAKYWASGAAPKTIKLTVPTPEELDKVVVDQDKLEKFLQVCHDKLSDRTLSYVPRIAAAVAVVYRMPMTRALVKAAEILVSYEAAKQLSTILEPKEIIELRSKIELIPTLSDRTSLETTLKDIEKRMNSLIQTGAIDQSQVEELKQELNLAAQQNPIMQAQQANAQAQQAAMQNIAQNAFASPATPTFSAASSPAGTPTPGFVTLGNPLTTGTKLQHDSLDVESDF